MHTIALYGHIRLVSVLLGTFLSFCPLLYECRKLDGYEFPVYSTDFCPRNQTEWNERSSAINCTETNGYLCFPNEQFTQLLEFCHKQSFVWIEEGSCLYLGKDDSAIYAYSCSSFQSGCHNSPFQSNDLFKHPSCTSIGNGCFLAEPFCKRTTPITYLEDTTVYKQIKNATTNDTDDRVTNFPTDSTDYLDVENGSTNTGAMILVATVLGVVFISLICCVMYIFYKKVYQNCKRNDNVESNVKVELTQLLDDVEKTTNDNSLGSGERRLYNESHVDEPSFEKMQQENEFFISTKASGEVENLLERQNLVIVTGHAGSGKSAIIQHIALKYRNEGWVVKEIKDVKEIKSSVLLIENNKNKFLYILNDPIGKESFDKSAFKSWRKYEDELKACLAKAKVLLSCRKYILRKSRESELLSDGSRIVDITNAHYKLTADEKKEIFKAYAPDNTLYTQVLPEIVKVEAFYPLLCKSYFTSNGNQQDILIFFQEPVTVFKKEITNFRNSCREEYCALILLVLFNNGLCVSRMLDEESKEKFEHALKLCGKTDTPPYFFADIFDTLNGFLVQRIKDTYQFYNSFVRDITTCIFGSDYPADVIKYADIDFLRRRVYLKCCSDQNDVLTLLIDDSLIDDVGKRLSAEIFGKEFLDVILNPCLKCEKVIKVLMKELEHHLEVLLKKIELQSVKRELLASNLSLLSKLTFIEQENELSPMCAIIVFCPTNISLEFLKPFKQNLSTFKRNSVFSAVCCNGAKDLFDIFAINDVKKSLTEKWGNLYPIHILSMFHNFEILLELIQLHVNEVNLNSKSRDDLTPLILAAGDYTGKCENYNQENSNETSREKTIQILVNNGAEVNLCTKNGVSPLKTASQNGYDKTVEILLKKGANINQCDKYGISPLNIACQNGHDKTVEILLKKGANFNECDKNGNSPLLKACQNEQHYKTVEILLKKGADKNKCNDKKVSPLHKACQNGHYRIVELLLRSGAEINICDENGLSPLHIACQNGNDEIVELLLKSGVNINLRSKNGSSSLCLACEMGYNKTIKHLLSYKADKSIYNNNEASPLFLACKNGHSDTVKTLLEHGANVNLCDKNGASPLYIACEQGSYTTVNILLDKKYGASINSNSTDGSNISKYKSVVASPLFIACEKGHELIARLLLEKGADFNASVINGTSPLHKACENGHKNIVQLLLDTGKKIDSCNQIGASPLYIACLNKHNDTVKLLLSKGASVDLCDENGISPLFIACQKDYDTIINLLLIYKADINLCDKYRTSPLYVACQYGRDGAVQLLLSKGARVNLCDRYKTSPLFIACENGHDSTVQHLLNTNADIDLSNASGASPLFVASQNGHTNIVENLLWNGANCNSSTKNGESPLYTACQNGHNFTVQYLISYGADCNLCDKNGISPLSIAIQKKHDKIEETLKNISQGVNNLCEQNGTSPLFRACQNGYMKVVQSLLSRKANINSCLSNGATPFFIACLNRHDSIVQLLLNHGTGFTSCYDKNDKTNQFVLYNEDNIHGSEITNCIDENYKTIQFLLYIENNIFDYMHEPDSFISLFLYHKAELMLRMTQLSDCF